MFDYENQKLFTLDPLNYRKNLNFSHIYKLIEFQTNCNALDTVLYAYIYIYSCLSSGNNAH